jgi:hypothetical protein
MMRRRDSGFVLIAVVGISMVLLMLSLAYLQTMRGDAERVRTLEAEARCRAMLTAACAYIQETSRIGWGAGDAATGWHGEAFGWRDVRDGSLPGPRGLDGKAMWAVGSGRWPDPGSTTRGVMYRMVRPPFALKTKRIYNELRWDSQVAGYRAGAAVTHWNPWPQAEVFPDPEPAANWTAAERDAAWLQHCQGDRRPAPQTHRPWFRLYRRPAPDFDTFVVTCGSGATYGFKDWSECNAFNSDPANSSRPEYGAIADSATFALLRAEERLLWFEIRWSPAVLGRQGVTRGTMSLGGGLAGQQTDQVSTLLPPNVGATSVSDAGGLYNAAWGFLPDVVNQCGTIAYIQRLEANKVGSTW